MVMKKDGRKRDIKSKLVAAVCMLLVSCIMMVSSTYAWFTLSTAPEVTGITTAVGANGNLEMALLPNGTTVADALAAIGNATGSMNTIDANTTWGNLVDLSEGYGLDKITLYPSTMGAIDGKIPSNYLSTPTYGADGRYSGLKQTASAAIYNVGAFNTAGYGVRAIGTSSGMSAMEMDYRTALAAGNNALQSAIASSKTAVSTGASKLASIAVVKANGTTTFTAVDRDALVAAYEAIELAIGHMETALKNYIIADYLSSGPEESTYAAVLEDMQKETLAVLSDRAVVKDAMEAYADALTALKTSVVDNREDLQELTVFTWESMGTYVTDLANTDKMLLNDKLISYNMENNFAHAGDLISQMSNLQLVINGSEQYADTGIFAQMADFINDFSTPATISGISYQGISADNLQVTVFVNANLDPASLELAKNEAVAYDGTPFGSAGGSNLTDFYGYILDMAFRTNAADSYLKLQTEGVDRIYADSSSNPTTMGGGSTISYSIPANSGFSTDKLINLMSFIRVVFFNPVDNSIFGYAKLDTTTAEISGSASTGWTVKMQIKMTATLGGDFTTGTDAAKIVNLVQNEATAVSTMVYLDGVNLSNADIANANLTGTMNLQFASSAELNPMEYGDLRNPNNNAGTTTPATPTVTRLTATGTEGYTYDAFLGEVSNQDVVVVKIANSGNSVTTGTVTIALGDGAAVTANYNETAGGWYVVPTGTVDSTTTVTVTVTP